MSWTHLRKVVGVFKAYCTRGGKGHFRQSISRGSMGTTIHRMVWAISSKAWWRSRFPTGRPKAVQGIRHPALRYAVGDERYSALVMTKIPMSSMVSDEIGCASIYKNMALNIFRRMGEASRSFEKFRWGCEIASKMKTKMIYHRD